MKVNNNIFHIRNNSHEHFNMYIGNNENNQNGYALKKPTNKNNIIPIENYLKK